MDKSWTRLPCKNVENLVAGPGEDKFADHPPTLLRPTLLSKTKAVVVTGIKKNSELAVKFLFVRNRQAAQTSRFFQNWWGYP